MEFLDEIINMRVKPSHKEILKKKADKENLSVASTSFTDRKIDFRLYPLV